MLSEAAPASLHQALPSSVQQLLLHAVPQHVSPAPPAATAERCEAIAALFDQECMRRATGGGGWTLTPARNGACEPPDAAAAGLASGAVQRCGPRLLVQLGASSALDQNAAVAARLAAGWAAIVAAPRVSDVAPLAQASASAGSGARLRLHRAAPCTQAAASAPSLPLGLPGGAACLDLAHALVGFSRVELLLVHAPGALAATLRAFPFRYLPPRTVVLAEALKEAAAGQWLRGLGYSRLRRAVDRRAGLQTWVSPEEAGANRTAAAAQDARWRGPASRREARVVPRSRGRPARPSTSSAGAGRAAAEDDSTAAAAALASDGREQRRGGRRPPESRVDLTDIRRRKTKLG